MDARSEERPKQRKWVMVCKLPTTDESTPSKWQEAIADRVSWFLPWLSSLLFKPRGCQGMLQSSTCTINPWCRQNHLWQPASSPSWNKPRQGLFRQPRKMKPRCTGGDGENLLCLAAKWRQSRSSGGLGKGEAQVKNRFKLFCQH